VSVPFAGGRVRAYLEFVAAILYFFVARSFAQHLAARFATDLWTALAEQAFLALLLVMGYAAFGSLFDRQKNSIAGQGLPLRPGWPREAGIGLAIGWTAVVLCILPLTMVGGIAVVLSTDRSSWGWLLADAAFFALAALAEEVAFRGYGFQRFEQVVGSHGAALGFALFYAIVQALQPGSSKVSIAVSIVFSLLLSMTYVRTRALWMSWGFNFAWKATRALIFGLAVSGVNSHSSVVEGDPMGPFWLTGGGYGLDGSRLAFVILFLAFPVVYRLTRDLDFVHNALVIVPGGVAVDLDAAARRQHESAMGPANPESEPAAPSLIQILPAASPPSSSRPASETSMGSGDSH
jgi:membrane protease YdiL (CAAX protease family)